MSQPKAYYTIRSLRYFDEVFDENREPEPEPDDTWSDDEFYEWWSKPCCDVLCDVKVENYEEAIEILRKECANPNVDNVTLGYEFGGGGTYCSFDGDRLWKEEHYLPEFSYHVSQVDMYLEDKATRKLSHNKFLDEPQEEERSGVTRGSQGQDPCVPVTHVTQTQKKMPSYHTPSSNPPKK